MLLWLLASIMVSAQTDTSKTTKPHYFKQTIIPAGLIGIGALGLGHNQIRTWSHDVQQEIVATKKFPIDNYIQFVPVLAVYGLNFSGIKGEHNFRDRTMILAMAYLISSTAVTIVKKQTGEMRPDYSTQNSFPSGHTTTAFMNAEFLRLEYKDVSPWIGVAGYAFAFGTGYFRMYNNKHYLNDVLAGAGFGILSARLSYWIYPQIQKLIFKEKRHNCDIAAMPYYDNVTRNAGLCCAIQF